MPVQLVVADAGTHLVFHDNSWDGRVTLREGEEGAGSGHDRPGTQRAADGRRAAALLGGGGHARAGAARLGGADRARRRCRRAWALGHQHARWGFGSEQEVRRVVAGYRERGLPLDAVHLDIDHYDAHQVFTVDRERFPDLPRLAAELRRGRGAAGVDRRSGGEGRAGQRGVRQRGGRRTRSCGTPRGGEVRGVRLAGRVRSIRTSRDPRVRKWWGELYEERLAQGFAGVWHDMNEPVSFARLRRHRRCRVRRGTPWRDAAATTGRRTTCTRWRWRGPGYEGLRELRPEERPFLFSRSGWAGMQRYGGTWSGDVATGWPGLRASLSLVLGLGLCGVPYSGPDVGGFDGSPSPELYLRWFQLGAYLPLFRTHAAMRAGRREPWEFGDRGAGARAGGARRAGAAAAVLRDAGAAGAAVRGRRMCGRCGGASPEDRALRDCEDAFLLGDALLVAPVLEPGADRRAVRLPRGRWYDTATGAGVRRARAGAGGRPPVADPGAGAGGCGGAGTRRRRRAGAGGVGARARDVPGAGWWCRTRATAGTSRRSSGM